MLNQPKNKILISYYRDPVAFAANLNEIFVTELVYPEGEVFLDGRYYYFDRWAVELLLEKLGKMHEAHKRTQERA